MSHISSQINLRKKLLIRLNNSNKNIFIKRYFPKKDGESNIENVIPEKIIKKKIYKANTSVKKIRTLKKININDYEAKPSFIKNENQIKGNKSFFIKKNDLINLQKIDENKENRKINQKVKIENKKINRKSLKIMLKDDKMKIEQNSSKIKKIEKIEMLNKNKGNNKLSKSSKDKNNYSDKEKSNQITTIRNSINSNKKNEPKENNVSKTLMDYLDNKTLVENGKSKDEEDEELEPNKYINSSNDDDIEYYFNYNRKKIPENKRVFNTSAKNTKKVINIRKEIFNDALNKNGNKSGLNAFHKRIKSNILNKSDIRIFNSINNNEKENGKKYIDLINNFDIINIISKKEQNKKFTKSINNNSYFNNSKEISEENFIKQYPTLEKKFQLNGLNIIYNGSSESKEEKEAKNDDSYIPKTTRNKDSMYKSITDLNSNSINLSINKINETIIKDDIYNTNVLQSKWNKKYFIPTVSASLLKEEEINKIKNVINAKKTKNNDTPNKIQNLNKKHINFGANNQKKREILFNFNYKENRMNNNRYISFHNKGTNSFLNKRNMHLTERNNSNLNNNIIYETEQNKSNRDIDLDYQEKKLKLICSEINNYKFKKKFFNISNNCSFSLNKITDNNEVNNKEGEITLQRNKNYVIQRNKINNRYKAFHIKLNPLNIIKKTNENLSNGDKLVIKRGDLLNRLRKIKHNYASVELSSIN